MNPSLHSPLQLGIWTLSHRVVMAPANQLWSLTPGGTPWQASARYYGNQASPGGLIVSEAAAVSLGGTAQAGTPGIFTAEQVHGWREITDAVHERGGIVFAQLWHAGRLARAAFTGTRPVSASDVVARGPIYSPALQSEPGEVPWPLDDDGIDTVIDEYRRAAENAADAGFDGVEMCCANGCLADQFLHDGSNRRQDRYGGTFENRTRFLVDAVQTLNSVWGSRRVGVRLSPLGALNDVVDSNPEALFAHVLGRLQGEGIAYVHLMMPDVEAGTGEALCGHWRQQFGGTLLLSGRFDAESAKAAIESGRIDAVAVGDSCIAALDQS